MALLPTNSGTSAVQAFVPSAIPFRPVEELQVTCVTPTLSRAAPEIRMELLEVEIVANDGLVIEITGGVESFTAVVV